MMSRSEVFLAATTLLLSAAPLSAQDNVREACMPDIRKYCSAEMMTFNRDAVRACLIKNIKKTSPSCRAAVKARRDAMKSQKTESAAK